MLSRKGGGGALADTELFVKFSKESADDCHFFLLCDWRDFPGGWLKVPEPWVVDSCWESEWSRKGVNLPTPHSELSTTLQNTLLELGSLLPGSSSSAPKNISKPTPLMIMSTKRTLTTCYATGHDKLVWRQFFNTDLYNYMGRGAGVGTNDLQFCDIYVVNTASWG